MNIKLFSTHPCKIDSRESLNGRRQLADESVDLGGRSVRPAQQNDFVRLGQRSSNFGGDLIETKKV